MFSCLYIDLRGNAAGAMRLSLFVVVFIGAHVQHCMRHEELYLYHIYRRCACMREHTMPYSTNVLECVKTGYIENKKYAENMLIST